MSIQPSTKYNPFYGFASTHVLPQRIVSLPDLGLTYTSSIRGIRSVRTPMSGNETRECMDRPKLDGVSVMFDLDIILRFYFVYSSFQCINPTSKELYQPNSSLVQFRTIHFCRATAWAFYIVRVLMGACSIDFCETNAKCRNTNPWFTFEYYSTRSWCTYRYFVF